MVRSLEIEMERLRYDSQYQREKLALLTREVELASGLPRCARRATACMVVVFHDRPRKEERLFYRNGPSGRHVCTGVKGGCGCAHAEQHAVADMVWQAAYWRAMIDEKGAGDEVFDQHDFWTFLSPCSSCANLILIAVQKLGVAIDRVVYVEELEHDQMGKRILIEAGVDVVKADRA